MNKLTIYFVCLSAFNFILLKAERKSYDGYKLLEIIPITKVQLQWLHNLMLDDSSLDFWQEPHMTHSPVHILVPPQRRTSLETLLIENNIPFHIKKDDIQSNLDHLWRELDARFSKQDANVYNVDLNNWNRWSDIMLWMDELKLACHPNVICGTYITGNRTYENRYQKVFKMGTGELGKKAFYVDSTHHAREWLTVATIMNIMDHMVRNYSTDSNVKHMIDTYDWYFVPVVNPDGYEYTFTTDRYWRKNRTPNSNPSCPGTDLNRNYDFRWGTSGTSEDPCSNLYRGNSAMSEIEVQNNAAEMRRLGSVMTGYVCIHSYANIWMFPWSNLINNTGSSPDDCELASDHADMLEVAEATAEATENTFNTIWTRGNACQVLYPMSGTSIDYLKGVVGVKYAQLPELRGDDFAVPVDEIKPSSLEIWNGIVAMVYAIEAQQS